MPNTILREVRRFIESARPDGDTDRALVEKFAATRDERAFAELVRRHGPMVLGVCRRVLRHVTDAEDAFQATFLILVRKANSLNDPDRLGSWLYGVAWRTANKLRMARRSVATLPDDFAERESKADWPIELDSAIACLPEKYRTPIVLCHLQGLSPAEAAGRVGCAPATIATRLFRARATLRRRLTALGLAAPAAMIAGSCLQVPSALASAVGEMAADRSISPAAARLADGVFRSLLMTKIRWAATAAIVCLGGVGVLGFRAGGQEPRTAEEPPRVVTPTGPVRDPLPPPSVSTSEATRVAPVSTANFRVYAASTRIGRLIADAAERARKDAAIAWLGKELPNWTQPCPVRVTIREGVSGATAFNFDGGKMTADMSVEGELERLLADTIPHEVTHCVMADHFRCPLPRWADEGISLMSESEEERGRHLKVARESAAAGKFIQTKALFASREYPAKDILGFFAQSYLVTKFLVEKKDRPTFVAFVKDGMKDAWESAVKTHYGFAGLNDLEKELLESLKVAGKLPMPTHADSPTLTNPSLVLATADEVGRISVGSPGLTYHAILSYVQRRGALGKDGQPVEKTRFEPITTYQFERDATNIVVFDPSEVKAVRADGKPIDGAKLLEILRAKPTPVILGIDWEKLESTYADMLKPETIILVPLRPTAVPAAAVPPAINR